MALRAGSCLMIETIPALTTILKVPTYLFVPRYTTKVVGLPGATFLRLSELGRCVRYCKARYLRAYQVLMGAPPVPKVR